MEIGYSDETLWSTIKKQIQEIESEKQWLRMYALEKDIGCVEDCVRGIENALAVIKTATEMLKSEEM